MAASEDPWSPDPRAIVLRTVLRLAGDMKVVSIDKHGGLYLLAGEQGQLIVWQNLPGWTDRPGSSWKLHFPIGHARLKSGHGMDCGARFRFRVASG